MKQGYFTYNGLEIINDTYYDIFFKYIRLFLKKEMRMDEQKKLLLQISELRKSFASERKNLEALLGTLESQVDRFISHIDLLDEKTDEMIEEVKKELRGIGSKIAEKVRQESHANFIEDIESLKHTASKTKHHIEWNMKQNLRRNIYIGIAFFLGVSLTVAAIEYFIPRNNYTVYSIDGDIKKVVKKN